MTGPEVIALLRVEVEKHPSIKTAAWKWGIDDHHLAKILRGEISPGLRVLKLLGLKRVLSYEKETHL